MNSTIAYGLSHGLISFSSPPPTDDEKLDKRRAYKSDWQRQHRAGQPKSPTKIDVHRSQFPDGPEGGKQYHVAYMKAWREKR